MADREQAEDYQDGKDILVPIYVMATVSGVGLLLGLVSLLLSTLSRESSSGMLRGRFLSNPCCAKCPGCRDCLLACGDAMGISCLKLGARDSLESICDLEERTVFQYDKLRETRRVKPLIVGVKPSTIIKTSAPTGYKWKKKWRERRMRNKQKRRIKNEMRKQKKQESQSESASAVVVPSNVTDTEPQPSADKLDVVDPPDNPAESRRSGSVSAFYQAFRRTGSIVSPSDASTGDRNSPATSKNLVPPNKPGSSSSS